jgi:hypothetical protein
VDVVAFAHEERMLADPRADDEIAAGTAERRGMSLVGHAHLRPRIDAGRNVDLQHVDGAPDTAATAGIARPGGGASVRPTGRARRESRDRKLHRRSANDVVEAHFDGEMDVLAAPPGLHGVVTAAEAVIESARVRIVEDPICFGDLVE